MAELIVWNLITLDGYFEGKEAWDLSFHEYAWGEELEQLSEAFGERAGLLVFGRKTYDGMKAYWTKADDGVVTRYMNALPKLVGSRTAQSPDWNNTEIAKDIVTEISRRKAELEKPIYVFGSAELSAELMAAGLVDELMLCLVPVHLGAGNPFFKDKDRSTAFELIDSKPTARGSVILRYRPKN